MCNISIGVVQGVQQLFPESSNMKIFVASDGQDPARDSSFQSLGAYFIDWSQLDQNIFPPVLDLFLLTESEIFIGNPTSSFSSLVATWRVIKRQRNQEVLSWPLVYPEMTMESFFKCARFEFWCRGHLEC